MSSLKPHSQNKTNHYSAHFERQGQSKFIFTVSAQSWIQSTRDKDPKKNWELWNQDVVEIFLQKRAYPKNFSAPYTELEVSTLGDGFVLQIEKPRLITWTPLDFNWHYEAKKISDHQYSISIEVPSFEEKYLWYVGIFGSFGPKDSKEYYSFNPNRGTNANFHLPQYFLPLDKIR